MKNRLKVIRAERQISQESLAEMANISRTSLAMIENEKCVPDGTTIAKLVSALGLPADQIFFDLGVV